MENRGSRSDLGNKPLWQSEKKIGGVKAARRVAASTVTSLARNASFTVKPIKVMASLPTQILYCEVEVDLSHQDAFEATYRPIQLDDCYIPDFEEDTLDEEDAYQEYHCEPQTFMVDSPPQSCGPHCAHCCSKDSKVMQELDRIPPAYTP
ncbi:hypothetical protein NDU88_008067 [Pleurodeles waltl]|uniref:Uncharacterized protein n=1 Tax=Pleurodeles waltl TaxID=8319 RepID=A0AAV7RRX8_PLEWA|nr:hypothetical protein NDU88_008067 [Pleurodeles waltl]